MLTNLLTMATGRFERMLQSQRHHSTPLQLPE